MSMEGITIAVIEDDAAVRDAVTLVLKSEGWPVQAYDSGEQFFAALGDIDFPRCIVLDLVLPGMSGVDVLSRCQGYDVVVVGLTAFPESQLAVQARALGIASLLTKPTPAKQLLETIRTCLSHPRAFDR